MKTKRIMTAALMLMLLLTLFSCSSSPSEPQAVIRKITVEGGYSLYGIPTEVKDGIVITFPDAKINGHDYTVTIDGKSYTAGDVYRVKSDVILNVMLNHQYTQWESNGTSTHFRKCVIEGCNEVRTQYHDFTDGKCPLCGYESDLFSISSTLASDTAEAMSIMASSDKTDPSVCLVKAGRITSSVSSIKLGEKTYQAEDTIIIDGSDPVNVFTAENGELKIAAPVLWFSMLDHEILKIGNESFLLPETEKNRLSVDSDAVSWSAGENISEVLFDGRVISSVYCDLTYENFLTLPFTGTDDNTEYLFRIMNISQDGTCRTSYMRAEGDISIYPFGESTDPVSSEDLDDIILISAYCEEGYAEMMLTFLNGNSEPRVNPDDIKNGETVKINKDSGIMYSVVTSFMPDYASSEEYKGDDFSKEVIVRNDLKKSSSRNLSRAASKVNVSKPVQNEDGSIKWDGMYVYHSSELQQRNMVEIRDDEGLIAGRDYDNGLLYLIDANASDEDITMINDLLDCLYYSGDDSLMPDNYIAGEQAMLKTKPSENYLFPMEDSGVKHKLFTIAIYDFEDEGTGMLGYFSASLYDTDSSRNGYAAFFMNLASIRNNIAESGTEAAAKAFLSTFAHEYAHYLQVDGKYSNAYTHTVDMAHFLEEGLADYISLKQNGTFDTEHGVYDAENGYISGLFSESAAYHPRSEEHNLSNYGVGCMFWSYIEEKYQPYGGMEVVVNMMRQDTDTLEAVERELKKPFTEVYEDFMLEVIAEALGTDEINGVRREMKFPKLYEVKRIYDEAMKTEDGWFNDADKTEMSELLGPMSFFIVRYPTMPTELTFTSESEAARCYLVYID